MKSKVWIIILSFSAIVIGLYPLMYFIIDRTFGLLQTKDISVLKNVFWNIGFYVHIIFGGLTLLIGWKQFVDKWRVSKPDTHRFIGKMYIVFVVLSSISGMYIAFYATGGVISALGFIGLGLFWFFITISALKQAQKRNFAAHRNLMIYSYSACFAAVTLRIWLPLLTIAFGDFFIAYRLVAWLCWIPNITVAYFIINTKGRS